MEELTERWEPRGVDSVFIYTREAHPGEKRGHHTSFADKLEAARTFKASLGIQRRVLVDGLDGPVHRAFGSLPNMTYVLARRGRVLYRASWTDPRGLEAALEQLAHEKDQRRDGHRILPYYAEMAPGKVADRKPFARGLLKNAGLRALAEYTDALEALHGEAAAAPLRRWMAEGLDED